MPPTGVSSTYGPSMDRPPVERYARTSLTIDGVTIEPGIQYERGEDSNVMSHRLRDATRRAVNSIRIPLTRVGFDSIAIDIEREIIALWPRRAYFIEIHDDAAGHWTQVFQPYGIPLNGPPGTRVAGGMKYPAMLRGGPMGEDAECPVADAPGGRFVVPVPCCDALYVFRRAGRETVGGRQVFAYERLERRSFQSTVTENSDPAAGD